MTDDIGLLANIASLILAFSAFFAFFASRRISLCWLLTWLYLRAISRTPLLSQAGNGRGMAWRRCQAHFADLLSGQPWTLAVELQLLSHLSGSRNGIGWDAPLAEGKSSDLGSLARAYRTVGREVGRSLLLRIGDPELAATESNRLEAVSEYLDKATDWSLPFEPTTGRQDRRSPIDELFMNKFSTVLLQAPPTGGMKGDFDEVVCTLSDDFAGPGTREDPTPSFEQIAGENCAFTIPSSAPSHSRDAIRRRAVQIAKERVEDPLRYGDYNACLPRLRGWRVERSNSSSAERLHLSIGLTNFAYDRATSGALHLRHVDGWDAARDSCLDRFLDAPERSYAANALPVHLALVTSDGFLVLAERSKLTEMDPGRINSSANGLSEIGGRLGLVAGDLDANGLVDMAGAAAREAAEELGRHVVIERADTRVRALALTIDGSQQVTPYLIFEARTPLTFDELAQGHFSSVSMAEGAFEMGGNLLGLPITGSPDTVAKSIQWMKARFDRMTLGALVSSTLTAMRVLDAERLITEWNASPPTPVDQGWAREAPTQPLHEQGAERS